VRLALTREPARLLIRIRNDGPTTSGPTTSGPTTPTDTPSGHGIDGMRERARALSGRLTAAPQPDGGFEVRAELPIPNPP
jgi:signal transduction histidine kinase